MGPLLDPLGGPRALDPRNSSGMHVEELGPTTLASCTTHVGGGTVGRWECGGSSRRAASRSRGPSWRELYAFSPLACVCVYSQTILCQYNVSCILEKNTNSSFLSSGLRGPPFPASVYFVDAFSFAPRDLELLPVGYVSRI